MGFLPGRTLIAPALVAVMACASVSEAAGQEGTPAVREIMERLQDTGRYQFVLQDGVLPLPPGAKPLPPPPPWEWRVPDLMPGLPQGLWFLLGLLVVAVLAVILLPRILDTTARTGKANGPRLPTADRTDAGTGRAPAPPPTGAEATRREAEALAAAGDFSAAAHRLWRGTLVELGAHRLWTGAPSDTGREVVRSVRVPSREGERLRDALTALVRLVEVSRFGTDPLHAAQYHTARGAFDQACDTVRRTTAKDQRTPKPLLKGRAV